MRSIAVDPDFRHTDGPRFGGFIHGPESCNSHGYFKRCEDCPDLIYLWTCDHLKDQNHTWIPFESWLNGDLEWGYWRYHNDGFCPLSHEEYLSKHGTAQTDVAPPDFVESLRNRLETARRFLWEIVPEPTTLRFAENFQSLLRQAGALIASNRVAAEMLEAMVEDVENLTEDTRRRWEEWREDLELELEDDSEV
jgi:hypothetical protein